MDGFSILVGLLAGLVLGAGAVFAVMLRRGGGSEEARAERDRADAERDSRAQAEQRLAALQASITEREKSFAAQQQQFDESRRQLVDVFKATGADVLRANSADFKQMSETALRPLHEQVVKSEALVTALGRQVEGGTKQLDEKLKNLNETQLRATAAADALSSAMRDSRQRGTWGEFALRTLVEKAGLLEGVQFVEQKSCDGVSKLRPDMVVNLPGGRAIPIDSKVPLDAYLKSFEPGLETGRRDQLLAEHAKALKGHVQSLSKKDYPADIDGSLKWTVLFLPLESALIAALENDRELYQVAMDSRIIIACPATLLPLLETVAVIWGHADAEKHAMDILTLARDLLDRRGTLVGFIDDTGVGLEATVKAYNKMLASFKSRFNPQLNRIAAITHDDLIDSRAEIDETPGRLEVPGATAGE